MDRSLLLIKPGSMGDVIHSLPVAAAIHREHPDTKLTWVVDPRWAPLLEGNPAISRLLLFPREKFRGPVGWLRAIRWYAGLSVLRPDVVVDLQGLMRSALMARFSGGREIIGLSDAREGASSFYHKSVPTQPGEHAVRRYLRCLSVLGISGPQTCEFPLPPGSDSGIEPGFIVLHPYARGAGKSMDAALVGAFVKAFQAASKRPVVIVGVGESSGPPLPGVVDLTGKTSLAELIGILRAARFVVSVDSGPMHLAAAIGVPLLGIHTWTDPRLVGPYGGESWIWQGGEIRRQEDGKPPLAEKSFNQEAAGGAARFVAAQTG